MKLLCKKTLINWPITQGKYYTMEKIDDIFYPCRVIDDKGYNHNFTDIPFHQWIRNAKPHRTHYIWDYFYTPQEERKIKLQKLNEITL